MQNIGLVVFMYKREAKMNTTEYIRKMARGAYWQNIYKTSKECSNISLFSNMSDFSAIQSEFLYWLRIYDMLYSELAQKECIYLTEAVIENDYRCDAFLYYRKREIEKQIQKNKMEDSKSKIKSKGKHKGKVTPWQVDMRG